MQQYHPWKAAFLCGAIVAAFGFSCTSVVHGEEILGRKINDFKLGDYRGKDYSLVGEKPGAATVVAFLGTECPLANVYAHRLQQTADQWTSKGVRFLAVMSNQQDSLADVAEFVKKHSLSFPVLKDPGNKIADQFAAERTPEIFVLDRDLQIRYFGRVDDQYGVGYQRPKNPRQDLELAIEQVVAGKPVETPTTKLQGCLIGRVRRAKPTGDVTFHKDVAKIFQHRCVECHHDGQVAPFSLIEYQEVVGWAEMIREVLDENRMPPWLASPAHGKFSNNPSLTDSEKKTILAWIKDGCPEGNPKDAPKPVDLAKGWGISGPDQVFKMSDKPYTVPAEGTVRYQYYLVDPKFTEDKWIQEAEVKAGSPAVVHHVIVFIERGGGLKYGQPQMAYAPGMPARKMPKGQAIRLPAGCKLRFQVHYTPNGIQQDDLSYVGFKYADPKDVTHEVVGGAAGVLAFVIPPGDPNYRMVATQTLPNDSVLIGMNPHMHVRGKSFKYEVRYPDGREEVLLDVPKYDFNWQLWYNLVEPKTLPKGSVISCTAYFDNSPGNPSNPDPTKKVTWGEQTWDEMMFGFYSTVEPRDDAPSPAGGRRRLLPRGGE